MPQCMGTIWARFIQQSWRWSHIHVLGAVEWSIISIAVIVVAASIATTITHCHQQTVVAGTPSASAAARCPSPGLRPR